VRRILAQESDAERRLDSLLDERRRELEQQAARVAETVETLERREQLLRDSRASLERLLRLGTSDLESREAELLQLMRDVTAREERVREGEAELARRRTELGAVELKRAALERRERALEEREEALRDGDSGGAQLQGLAAPVLAFVPGEAYRLHALDGAPLAAGASLTLDGVDYVVARVGSSPLPGDARRCAYLVRGPRGWSPARGSS
jgi:hypothetical protein